MKKVSFLHSIYIRFLFQLIVLAVVPLTLLITILTSMNAKSSLESRYRINNSVSSSIIENITNTLDFTSRTTQSLLSNQDLIQFLNEDYSDREDYDTYTSSIQSYVQATINANPHTKLYIYAQNESIPMSMDVFYHLSDIRQIPAVASFLASDDIESWLCASDFPDTSNIFLFSTEENFIYLRKAYDSKKNFLGLIVCTIPEHYVLTFDGDEQKKILSDGHSRIINLTRSTFSADTLAEITNMDSAHMQLDSLLITRDDTASFPFTFYTVTESSNYERLLFLFVAVLGIFSLLSIVICTRNLHRLVLQMNHCLSAMDTSISNNYKTRVPVAGSDEMTQIERRINLLLDQADDLLKENIQKETSNKESKLIALQHQINPHFIYNTMEVFSSKMKLYGYYEDSDAMVAFANLFRYNVATNDSLVTLREELFQTRNYLDIEKLRHPMLSIETHIAEEFLDTPIPKFTLQPIIENAIQHGIPEQCEQFVISLRARADGHDLLFAAANNGLAISPQQCQQLNQTLLSDPADESLVTDSHSIGLRNINSRLRLYFGSSYHLHIRSDSTGTTVEFHLPLRSDVQL